MFGENKFQHYLPGILKHGIGILGYHLKIADNARTTILDITRYLLEIDSNTRRTAHHDWPHKKRAKADRQSCGLPADK